jgi:hypothetical protein
MFDQIKAAVDHAASVERGGWSGATRSSVLRELLVARERLEALILEVTGEWDAAGVWAEDGAGSARSWVAQHGSMTQESAARLVRCARLVQRHERTRKALTGGDISVAHVDIAARAARHREDLYGEHETVLVDAARSLAPGRFQRAAAYWRHMADTAAADADALRLFERRYLHVSATFGGAVAIEGMLDPEGGARVMAALDALCRPDPTTGVGRPRSLPQRRADALVTLASGERVAVDLDVVTDADSLAGRAPTDLVASHGEIRGVGPVAPGILQRLACDASVRRVVIRGGSEVLELGRRTRLVSPALRRALEHRDQGCVELGCDAPPEWCDAHHRIPWWTGGETNLDNLELRCRRHHVDAHEGRKRRRRPPLEGPAP